MLPNLLIAAVVGALALRYFYVSQQWRRSVELEARARIRALQARIRPHFLFNSMNTIASLTRSNPAQAEEAIEDLSDLFRVSLSDARAQITLEEELEIARTYQRIEQLRLGDRLQVRWDVGDLPPRCAGAEPAAAAAARECHRARHRAPAAGRHRRRVAAASDDGAITLEVTNPKPSGTPPPLRRGHRMALDNIRQRLDLAFPGRAAVEVDDRGEPVHGPAAIPARRGPIRLPRYHAVGHCRAAFVTRGPVHRTIPVRAWHEDTPSPADSEKLRALIVDDEAPARERLRRLLEELGDVTIVGEATNGAEALDRCATLDPDLVLLDVRMPGMDGIEAARHLGALDEPPAVIFTTAHDEYALAAFETEAVGYLLKPVRREKLARAVRHAARIAGPQLARLAEQSQLGRRRTQICARLGEQLRLVPIEDVLYFSAGQKYVTLRHRGGQRTHRRIAARARTGIRAGLHPHSSQLAGRTPLRAGRRAQPRRPSVRATHGLVTKPCRSAAGTRRRPCARSAPDTETP